MRRALTLLLALAAAVPAAGAQGPAGDAGGNAAGDAVLLMSDGLAERLDPSGEPLGYERAAAAFATAAGAGAAPAIERLLQTAESWAGGRPADDDLTLLVLTVPTVAS